MLVVALCCCDAYPLVGRASFNERDRAASLKPESPLPPKIWLRRSLRRGVRFYRSRCACRFEHVSIFMRLAQTGESGGKKERRTRINNKDQRRALVAVTTTADGASREPLLGSVCVLAKKVFSNGAPPGSRLPS